MAQSPEELERLRNSGAAGFQAQQQPAPAPKKKPKPSEEMAGVDTAPRWNLEGVSSEKASQQVIPNVDASKSVSPDLQGTQNLARWQQTGDQGPRLSDQGFGYHAQQQAATPTIQPAAPAEQPKQRPLTAAPVPSNEMAGVDQMAKWPKPDSISLAMSLQPNANATAQVQPDAPMPQEPQANGDSGFNGGLLNPIVRAALGTGIDTIGALTAKPADAVRNSAIEWAGGDPDSVEGGSTRDQDRAFKNLQGRIDTVTDTVGAVKGAVGDALGFVVDKAKSGVLAGTGAEKKAPVAGTGPYTGGAPQGAELDALNAQLDALDNRPASKPATDMPQGDTAPATQTDTKDAGNEGDTKPDSSTTGSTGNRSTQTAMEEVGPPENDIKMVINEEGNKSFSGRNIGAGATLNGKPFSNAVNVVPSEGMRQLAAAVNPPMAPQQPQQQAPAIGFAPRQSPQRTPKTEFEKQVEREIFRQATTAMRGSQNGQLTASQRGSLDKLNGGFVNERSGFDQQALRNSGTLDQTAMIQAGQDRREGARLALDTAKYNSDQYAQGFQIRQNERLEALREAYTAAETPEQRSAIAEQLQILNGSNSNRKVQDDYVMVDQVIQNSMGDPTTVRVAVDPATNRVLGGIQAPGQAWPEPSAANIKKLKSDPSSAALFDAQFGPGAAARYGVGQ